LGIGGAQQFKKNHFRADKMSAGVFHRGRTDITVFLRARRYGIEDN
jgi:hypothetical protein